MPREHHQHARPALLPRARHTHRHGGISLPRVPPRGTGAVNSPAGLGTGQPRFAEPSRVGTQASADRGPRRPAQALTQTKPNPPPHPPGLCYLGVGPCRSFFLVLLLLPCFFRAFGLGTCLVGFLFPPSAPSTPPAPSGGCSWWCAVPRVLFCGAAVGCGLLRAARGVLLRRAVLLCGRLAVWCACLVSRWPSPVGVGNALPVGVARCSASPCCFVRCFVVCGAVVRCRVLWCFPCCCVVLWLFSLCLLGSAHLRVRAPVPPPPPNPMACVSCLLPVCVAAVCWLVLPFVVPCCCLLCCVVRGVACRVVLCRVLLCSAAGVVLRCVSSCGCALLRALPC